MLDVIINMSNSELKNHLIKETKLCNEKVENVFPIAGVCIITTLKEEILKGNIDKLIDLINQKDSKQFDKNSTFEQLKKNLVSSLNCKLGLNKPCSEKISELFLQFVISYLRDETSNNKGEIDSKTLINLINGKVNEPEALPDLILNKI